MSLVTKGFLISLALLTASAYGQSPDSKSVLAVRKFVEILNKNDLAGMKQFVETAFVARPDKRIADRARNLMGLVSSGAPFKVVDVLKDTPTTVILLVQSESEANFEIRMDFESDDRHLAKSVYMGGPGSQTGPPAKKHDQWIDLGDLLRQIRAETGVPALSVGFVHGLQKSTAIDGVRLMNSAEKSNRKDRWLVGSLAKAMTSTMIARLVDQGKIRWDTTLGSVFPKMAMREQARSITLLQLLNHRSGLPQDLYVTPEFLKMAAGSSIEKVRMRDHYLAFILERPPIGAPGEKMRYSNAGYAVAAHMAETVTGVPFERLMRDLVFHPLRMHSARFGVPGNSGEPGATSQLMGHTYREGKLVPYVISEPSWVAIQCPAGAGLAMTLDDLLRFAKFHLEGMRGHVSLMKPDVFHVLHEPASKLPGEDQYACGWILDSGFTKEPFQGHSGSDGTFRAEIALWPDRDLAAVAISNASSLTDPSPPLQAVIAIYERTLAQKG